MGIIPTDEKWTEADISVVLQKDTEYSIDGSSMQQVLKKMAREKELMHTIRERQLNLNTWRGRSYWKTQPSRGILKARQIELDVGLCGQMAALKPYQREKNATRRTIMLWRARIDCLEGRRYPEFVGQVMCSVLNRNISIHAFFRKQYPHLSLIFISES